MWHLLSSYCHPINSLLRLTSIEIISVHIFSLKPGNNLTKQTAYNIIIGASSALRRQFNEARMEARVCLLQRTTTCNL
jgi:hypothetical protein